MNEVIIGILGGGAFVQLLNVIFTLRQSRRQINATALGGEVEALERTIRVLSENIERENQRHNEESQRLREQIKRLEEEVTELRLHCAELETALRRATTDSGN